MLTLTLTSCFASRDRPTERGRRLIISGGKAARAGRPVDSTHLPSESARQRASECGVCRHLQTYLHIHTQRRERPTKRRVSDAAAAADLRTAAAAESGRIARRRAAVGRFHRRLHDNRRRRRRPGARRRK